MDTGEIHLNDERITPSCGSNIQGVYHRTERRTGEPGTRGPLTEFRQPHQVQSHLEMPRILVQLGHIQHT